MAGVKGYSLWLMPKDDVSNYLYNLIFQLSKKYSKPNFEPHITLIGELAGSEKDIISKTSQLAAVVKPYKVMLTKVEYLDEYFRCLFIKVKETDDVMNANSIARKIFNRNQDPKYEPHLSLMYGKLSIKTKEKIIGEIGNEFYISFEAKSIHLFLTNGEPRDWHRIKEITLNSYP
jgi:2'-5' RNA ligase